MPAVLDSYVAEAERVGTDRGRTDPEWLTRARCDELARFQSLGFPTTHEEDWRFTSVAPIADGHFTLAHDGASCLTREGLTRFEWRGDLAAKLVFVNGHFVAAASDIGRLPAGVRVESLAGVMTGPASDGRRVRLHADLHAHLTRVASAADRHAFTALNTAFLLDGAFVDVPDSTIVDAPIHLLFASVADERQMMTHPRVLVMMGANSQASIVESYVASGPDRYFTNTVTEVTAGENATVHHYKVQRESLESFHIGSMYVRAARDAHVFCHSISLGGSLARNDTHVVLDGEGGACTLNGLYLADGARLVDNHTTIDHARPHCSSREVYKGILADRARAVFNGKIIVRPDAQKTDAKQTNKALLLSEDAQINTKPQLEICANDVKCTHGAAVGQMDEEAIFYLRARGLSQSQARHLLIRAFVGDVLSQMPLEPLRARIDDELARRLPEGRS
jgi:Fe-S cluster assembly protein SufD